MTTADGDIRPDDHELRMEAAKRRAEWELGDSSWAGIIVGAYLYPAYDAEALKREQDEAGVSVT